MALRLMDYGKFDDSLPKNVQLMKQCIDTYSELGEITDQYIKEKVYFELVKIANGEVYWKKLYLKDKMWKGASKIEILANPVHMAIILGNEDLALQIYERYNIAYDKDEIMELVRYSTMKGNVIQTFSVVDVFVAFASRHEIWKNFVKNLYWKQKYKDVVIFNNVFLQYKTDIEFPVSHDIETLLIERLRGMDSGIPGYFVHSEMVIEHNSDLLYEKDFVTILQKICIFLQAFEGYENAAERHVESYMKNLSHVYLDEDVHYNLELNALMEKMEKLCDANQRLSSIFFGLLLILATKQAENIYYCDFMTPVLIEESENASTEGVFRKDYFIEWAKKRNSDYTIGDFYNLVKKLDLEKEFVIKMTDIFNSLQNESEVQ